MTDCWDSGFEIGGRFVVRYLLSDSGASAFVYLCEDTLLKNHAVIKALRPEHAKKPEHVERFQREIQMLTKLNHPNIVKVITRGTEAGIPWYAMEYCTRSETLPQFVEKFVVASGSPGRVPIALAHKLAVQLVHALYAISPACAHRDIKPHNILITRNNLLSAAWSEDPEDYHLVLLDFGLAKGRCHKTMTRLGEVWGSDGYLAPEALEGDQTPDHRVDLYASAVVIAELLAGRKLSEDFKAADLAKFRPAAEVEPWIPIIDRQLSRNPDDRAEAREVLRLLESIKPTSSPDAPTETPAPRRRRIAAAALALFSALTAEYFVLDFFWTQDPHIEPANATRATGCPAQQEPMVALTDVPHGTAEPPMPNQQKDTELPPKQTNMIVYDAFGYKFRLPEDEPLRIRIE